MSLAAHRWIRVAFCFAVLSFASALSARAETWAEKLGYPSGKIVLILHADDIGMCYEANEAAKTYLTEGQIQSAAMMVPCPWFNEIAAWYKDHPEFDMGLHLAMNSEWKWYRWGPVAGKDQVPGMVDPDGYLWHDVIETATHASAKEIETEIRAKSIGPFRAAFDPATSIPTWARSMRGPTTPGPISPWPRSITSRRWSSIPRPR